MQRLVSGFVSLWIMIFAPSLIVWVLVVRSAGSGTDWFASTWHWVADKLVFPLVLSPATDPAWRWLETGGALAATAGFVFLVAVWAAMLALPPVVILFWWRLAVRRLPSTATYTTSYTASPMENVIELSPSTGSSSRTGSSPLAPLYLVTIPLALLWTGWRRVSGWAGDSLLLWAVIALFVLPFVLVTGFFALMFGISPYWERFEILDLVANTLWYGYLDTLRVPHIFHAQWREAYQTIFDNANSLQHREWPEYMGAWYRHPEFRTLVWITAARHGLAVVLVFLGYRLIRWVFR